MKKPRICIVVAIGKNRELGKEGKLLWHIPDDLKRFKMLTKNHPIIFGRKTFESVLGYNKGKPLPERTNIVVTRDPEFNYQGALVAHSLEQAIETAAERSMPKRYISAEGHNCMNRFCRRWTNCSSR